jgi:hypothetical protein
MLCLWAGEIKVQRYGEFWMFQWNSVEGTGLLAHTKCFFSSQRFFTTGEDIFHIIWFAWLSSWPCLSKSFVILCQIFTETQWLQRHQTHCAETIDAAFTMPPKRSRLAAPLPPMRRADLSKCKEKANCQTLPDLSPRHLSPLRSPRIQDIYSRKVAGKYPEFRHFKMRG